MTTRKADTQNKLAVVNIIIFQYYTETSWRSITKQTQTTYQNYNLAKETIKVKKQVMESYWSA